MPVGLSHDSKEGYLPVPTISREPKLLPAMINLSEFIFNLLLPA